VGVEGMAGAPPGVGGGAPTIGVCGCGIVTALSRGAGGLAGRVSERGALCSELSPTAPLSAQTLYARDRIIAGLADAVIVVAARARGGAVHTAKSALREGRPVYAVAWPSGRVAAGNTELLAERAAPLPVGGDAYSAVAAVWGG